MSWRKGQDNLLASTPTNTPTIAADSAAVDLEVLSTVAALGGLAIAHRHHHPHPRQPRTHPDHPSHHPSDSHSNPQPRCRPEGTDYGDVKDHGLGDSEGEGEGDGIEEMLRALMA